MQGGASLVGVDSRTDQAVVAIGLPSAIGMCTLGRDLWVGEPVTGNLVPSRLVRLDPTTGRVVAGADLPIQPAVMACGAGRVWLLDRRLTLVSYGASGTSATPAGIVSVPGQSEGGLGFTSSLAIAGGEVLIAQALSRSVWVVDPQLESVLATAHYQGQPLGVASDGTTAWLVVR